MITTHNYIESIEQIGISNMPVLLKNFHNDLKEGTSDFTDWSVLEDADIKESTELYFKELAKLLVVNNKTVKPENEGNPAASAKIKASSVKSDKYFVGQNITLKTTGEKAVINKIFTIKSGNFIPGQGVQTTKVEYSFTINTKDSIKTVNEDEISIEVTPTQNKSAQVSSDANRVENTSEDVKFIKSFVAFNNKQKTHAQIRSLLLRLQKAITHRLINKDSTYATEIGIVQDRLIKLAKATETSGGADIKVDNSLLSKLTIIAGGEVVYASIAYLKRYIGMQSKEIEKTKAESFVRQAEKAINSAKVEPTDPYLDRLKSAIKTVKNYITGKDKIVSISKTELNGLMGIVEGCGCGLAGTENSNSEIMSSMDFVNLKFDTIGFNGKWLDLIGDPSPGFSAMIYGKPKFGKSYLCMDFAGYLAKNHGKVLYVASEEDLFITLQNKVREKGVADPNLFLTGTMTKDLSAYNFIFLDSVSKLGLSPEGLTALEKQYPLISFIYVFHVRKDGNFKGRNDFQHDVDIVIEVPEKGHAVQYGRFNQGGEMDIFKYDEAA